MKLTKQEISGVVVVSIEGKLVGGPENSEQFHHFFKSLLDEGKNKVIVDLTETPWANSQGIGMLIGVHTSLAKTGGELALANVSDRIRDVLVVTRLLKVFTVVDTVDQALLWVSDEEPQFGARTIENPQKSIDPNPA